jgi:hypothetical protein
MMIRFPCPHCHGEIKAPPERIGAQGMCPRCQKWATVPAEAPARVAVSMVQHAPPALDDAVDLQLAPASSSGLTARLSSDAPPMAPVRELMKIPCPHCEGMVKAPKSKIGQPGVCPRCRKWFVVPSALPAETPSADALDLASTSHLLESESSQSAPAPTVTRPARSGGAVVAILVAIYLALFGTKLWQVLLLAPLAKMLERLKLSPALAFMLARGTIPILCGIPVVVAIFWWLKRRLLASMPESVEFLPASASQFPGLDKKQLLSYTNELQGLGFLHAVDYTPHTELGSNHTGFGRLFTHPQQHCYAEINQVIPAEGTASAMAINMLSLLGDGWSLATGNRDAGSVRAAWLWRRPRCLWTRHAAEGVSEMVAAHIERRQQIAADLGLEVETDLSAQAYFARERAAAREHKETLRRKNVLVTFFEYWRAGKKLPTEWLGAYPRLARRRI